MLSRHLHRTGVLLALAWSGYFVWQAFQRWSFAHWCAMSCGPFVRVELAAQFRSAIDWRSPLLLAALPLAVLGLWGWRRTVIKRSHADLAGRR
jgi:hypothetical protein